MRGPPEAPSIATTRLLLNPLRVEDAEEMVTVLGDPSLHEFTGGQPSTIGELRDRFAAWTRGSGSSSELWLNWVVRRRADDMAVGAMQATVVTRDDSCTATVAWTIGTPWQHQGYAGEAAAGLVRWLALRGVDSIVAHIHPDHGASAGVAARAGLRRTDEIVDGELVWRMDAAATSHD
jgi:RimJ/RimL family protein N-acetyltransferase